MTSWCCIYWNVTSRDAKPTWASLPPHEKQRPQFFWGIARRKCQINKYSRPFLNIKSDSLAWNQSCPPKPFLQVRITSLTCEKQKGKTEWDIRVTALDFISNNSSFVSFSCLTLHLPSCCDAKHNAIYWQWYYKGSQSPCSKYNHHSPHPTLSAPYPWEESPVMHNHNKMTYYQIGESRLIVIYD